MGSPGVLIHCGTLGGRFSAFCVAADALLPARPPATTAPPTNAPPSRSNRRRDVTARRVPMSVGSVIARTPLDIGRDGITQRSSIRFQTNSSCSFTGTHADDHHIQGPSYPRNVPEAGSQERYRCEHEVAPLSMAGPPVPNSTGVRASIPVQRLKAATKPLPASLAAVRRMAMLNMALHERVAVLPVVTIVAAIGVRIARSEVLAICVRVKLCAIAGIFDNGLRQRGSCGGHRDNSGGA